MSGNAGSQSPHEHPDPRIVGRDRDLKTLREHLAGVCTGRGRLVLIGGEAGIGKTTLLSAIAEEAHAQGSLVVQSGCYDLTITPPYGAWIDMSTRNRPGSDQLSIADMFAAGVLNVGSQDSLFQHILESIATAAARRPLVLVLEDMHWSDAASLELLRFISRRLATLPVLLLVTYRADELTRRHRLFQMLPLLVREADAVRLDLRRLDDGNVRELLTRRYGLPSADETRLVATLTRQTDGNPFFLHEMMRSLEEGELLAQRDGAWTLRQISQLPVPPLVRQVIENRLARLGDATRSGLASAAIIGQEVDLDLWQAVAGLTDDELLTIVEQSVDAQFLEASSDGARVRFVHALIRETLHESILPPRRRVWHRNVAERLLEGRSPDPDRVAHHLQQAGDPRATDWLMLAGERAQRGYAYQMAAERFGEAERLMEGDDTRLAERGWLLYRIGRLLRFADTARGIRYLEEAGHVARTVDDPHLAAYALADQGVLRCMANDIGRGLVDMEAGIAAIDAVSATGRSQMSSQVANWIADALPSAGNVDSESAELAEPVVTRRGTQVLWLAWAGRYRDALAIGEPFATQTATIPSARDGYGDTLHGLAMAYAATGRIEQARAAFEAARVAYRSINHHVLLTVTSVDELLEISLVYDADKPDRRRQLFANVDHDWRPARGAHPNDDWPRIRTLAARLIDGSWREARDLAQTVRDQQDALVTPLIGPVLGRLAREQGDDALAWSIISEGFPNGPTTNPGDSLFLGEISRLRLAVDLALDASDLPLAREWLGAHDRWLAWSGSVRGMAEAQTLWARYHHLEGDRAAALWHGHEAVSKASQPRQPLAWLSALRFLGQIETEAGDYPEAEDHLQQSLALADACAAPYERALTLFALAELRAAAAEDDDALTLLNDVRIICQALGAAPTLGHSDALTRHLMSRPVTPQFPAGLTAREVEVLRLVAQGLTDAEVAGQLFLARRTINTHLTSIYTKLNVSSRTAATRFAIDRGLV